MCDEDTNINIKNVGKVVLAATPIGNMEDLSLIHI